MFKNYLGNLSLGEKIKLLSGKNYWQTCSFNGKLPVITMADGPCGLRKQNGECDNLGLNSSVKSTCFPCPTNLASTFDRTLCKTVSDAIAKECKANGVNMLLAPAMNIKRNPLCGRNFEYYSEDTFLTAEMAINFTAGLEQNNVGACLKHFACNSQEDNRMQINCVVSRRALHEIYLKAFKQTIEKAKPSAVMASYNKINGAYVCENPYILKDILRQDWQFDGMTVSDWGGVNDRVYGLKHGLDLEMPASLGVQEKYIEKSLKKKKITMNDIDESCNHIISTALKLQNDNSDFKVDYEKHNEIARTVAAESAILLKNEDEILPLKKDVKVAVIGAFAKTPRFQGSGSSIVSPYKLTNFLEEMNINRNDYSFAEGFSLNYNEVDEGLMKQACELAYYAEKVIVFVGLPSAVESEGFDRRNMKIPSCQNELINRVVEINKNVIIVLSCGSIVEMPWIDDVKAVVNMQLAGQASGSATYDILYGNVVPSGRTNQSFVKKPRYLPSLAYYDFDKKLDEFRDDIFVGYRYFDWEDEHLLFPFGFGLSYTNFEYSDLKLSCDKFKSGDKIYISLSVKNVGNFDASEVVQVYVQPISLKNVICWSKHELKEFDKKFIKMGENHEFRFVITDDFFSYYNDKTNKFEVAGGKFKIAIGSFGGDERMSFEIEVEASTEILPDVIPEYHNFNFETVKGDAYKKLNVKDCSKFCPKEKGKYNQNSSINDLQKTFIGRVMKKNIQKSLANEGMLEYYELMQDNPLRSFVSTSNGAFSQDLVNAIISMANKHYLRGPIKIIRAICKKKRRSKHKLENK